MRRLAVIPPVILVVLVAPLLGPGPGHAQSLDDLYRRVEPSVVRVEAVDLGNAATGFVWGAPGLVVTSLHVVDGSADIQVHFQSQGVRRRAQVERLLSRADLVLLRVDSPPVLAALPHTSTIPSTEETVHTLGFPLNFSAVNSFTFHLRYGGRKLADNVSRNVLIRLRENGYPDPELEIVKLGNESLLPGLSGAPIFNREGQVVAVGDGGLEEGAINVSWGIPARHLDDLRQSSETRMPGAPGTRDLFAAELQTNVGPTISTGSVQLVKLRTRTFQEISATADDQLGLNQLSSTFFRFGRPELEYDIYQDIRSGATVVLPRGAEIHPQARGLWHVTLPATSYDRSRGEKRVQMLLYLEHAALIWEAQQQSVWFEQQVTARVPNVYWQPDPAWSYVQPVQRFDGLLVNRRAAYGMAYTGIMQTYAFETLAMKNNVFLGLAVINFDNSPGTTSVEATCSYSYQGGASSPLCESFRQWAQAVLGVQMTSFSF